MADYRCG